MGRRETGPDGFASEVMTDLRNLFPDAIIIKGNSGYLQGIPDILILLGCQWAMLECKRSAKAPFQPNQRYYVGLLNEWSFAAFIYPENKDDVLYGLQQAFRADR